MDNSAVDFIVLIVLLGVIIAVCINLSVPMLKESKELMYQENYDKTVTALKSERFEDGYDGCMSVQEVVICILSQNFFMPNPRIIDIAGQQIKVFNTAGYSPYALDVGNEAYTQIQNWFNQFSLRSEPDIVLVDKPTNINEARFIIQYDMNDPDKTCIHKTTECPNNGDESDDTYSLYIRCKSNTAPDYAPYKIYKLMPNGRLQDESGNII